jgi:hypothetical protein
MVDRLDFVVYNELTKSKIQTFPEIPMSKKSASKNVKTSNEVSAETENEFSVDVIPENLFSDLLEDDDDSDLFSNYGIHEFLDENRNWDDF